MDPFCSPYIIPNSSPHNPFIPHSLLRTRQLLGVPVSFSSFGTSVHACWAFLLVELGKCTNLCEGFSMARIHPMLD